MSGSDRSPNSLLVKFLPVVTKGRALDVACGEGRNALYLAKEGFEVDAVDRSEAAVNKGREAAAGSTVNFIVADLEVFRIQTNAYDLIVNFHYLQRSLAPQIKKGLKKGGVLIFETYTLDQKQLGPPNNPEFLLKPNELLKMFDDLRILYYREGIVEDDRKKAVASLVGRKIS